MERREFLQSLCTGVGILLLDPSYANDLCALFQSLKPWQTMSYIFQAKNYTIDLDESWVLYIQGAPMMKRHIHNIKIDFDLKVNLFYPFLSKEKKSIINTAKQWISIKDITQITIRDNSITFEINYDDISYPCAMPLEYFHHILNHVWKDSVTLNKKALTEIYKTTQSKLDEDVKKLYEKLIGNIHGLVIWIKNDM